MRRNVESEGFGRADWREDPLPKCQLLTTEIGCLARYGRGFGKMRTDFTRPSCVWHNELSKEMVETMRLTSWGTNPGQGKLSRGAGALNFRHSFCQLTVKATLPAGAKNKYTAYLSFFGGPYVADWKYEELAGMSKSRRETTASGCTIRSDTPNLSCTINYQPPMGYAKDERFYNNSLAVDFFLTDPSRIAQIKKSREVIASQRMSVDLELKWKRCGDVKPASGSPVSEIVNDQVVFGPTEFALEGNPLDVWKYYMVSYRTYFVKQVSGIDYEVSVMSKKSLDVPSRAITPLTVFVGQVTNDFYYDIDCNPGKETDTCLPPTEMRVKNSTVCTGTFCKGSVRGLDPKKSYILWVSYPAYLDPGNYPLNYRNEKAKTTYATQLVRTRMWAQTWQLGKLMPTD